MLRYTEDVAGAVIDAKRDESLITEIYELVSNYDNSNFNNDKVRMNFTILVQTIPTLLR